MTFKPIKKVVVHEAIVKQIMNYIENEELVQGAKLPPERKLAKDLQVSRNSIREALRTLEAQNIVEIKHGYGTYLKNNISIDIQDIDEKILDKHEILKQLVEIREMIENYTAIEVSKHVTDEQIELLYNLAKKESPHQYQNEYEFQEIPNLKFEIAITTLTNNQVLLKIHRDIEVLWKKYWYEMDSTPLTIETRYLDHLDIVEAIKSKKREKIENAIRVHLRSINLILNNS